MPPNSLFDVAVTMKPENAITRKENCKPTFSKHRNKSLKQNFSKPNPTTYKNR